MTERRLYNTDEQLLQGFRENDDRAWSIVLNDIDLRKMIFSLVIKNSGNEEDAILDKRGMKTYKGKFYNVGGRVVEGKH